MTDAPATDAVQAVGLGRRYRAMWALRDCSLGLPAGSVTALVGPNGAGKTTLLHLVLGLLSPSVGTVTVFGQPMRTDRRHRLGEIAFVAQDHPLYPGFTVAELLRLGRSLNQRWDQRAALERLADLGIPLQRRAGQLSGGQRAQVALTLALAKRPRLLVLDEPVASLDPLARHSFLDRLAGDVSARELTVILSSHVIGELERVCDHLVLLTSGKVRLAGPIDDLLAEHQPNGGTVAERFEQLVLTHLAQDDSTDPRDR